MNFIKLLPVTLSLLLLGAHFLRAGMIVLVLLVIVILFMLLIRKPWVVRLMQLVLVAGAIEWVRTLVVIVKRYQMSETPWIRSALILGGVILLTICSTLVFRARSLRKRYGQARVHQKKSD
jgi:hypothetical protein